MIMSSFNPRCTDFRVHRIAQMKGFMYIPWTAFYFPHQCFEISSVLWPSLADISTTYNLIRRHGISYSPKYEKSSYIQKSSTRQHYINQSLLSGSLAPSGGKTLSMSGMGDPIAVGSCSMTSFSFPLTSSCIIFKASNRFDCRSKNSVAGLPTAWSPSFLTLPSFLRLELPLSPTIGFFRIFCVPRRERIPPYNWNSISCWEKI